MYTLPTSGWSNICQNTCIKRLDQSGKSANQFVKSAKFGSVNFSAAVQFGDVVPHYVVCGWLPSTMVATCDGWKAVSAYTCHFTGNDQT